MRIAIVGSRDYANLAAVRRYVLSLPKDTIIISGGARGVDREAELAAYEAGLQVEIFFADWKTHGKDAGFIRNHEIVKSADRIVAFWDGRSRGTAHTIGLAKIASKPFEVIRCRRAPKDVSDNPGVLQALPRPPETEPAPSPIIAAARRRKARGIF